MTKTTTNRLSSALALGAALFALGSVASAAKAAKPPSVKSGAAQRKKVSITVYNSDLGLVREVRTLDIGTGQLDLEFQDVATQIQPATVHIRSLTDAAALSVLEQNYRYDLLSPETLLEKYVGKKIRVYRWNEKAGKEDAYDAELLSIAGGRPVIKIGSEITFDFPGRFAFPEVPDNLIANPTLVWLLDSQKPKQEVEVTYLTGGMNWSADYVLVVDDKDASADLTGWVTLVNNSGTTYEDADLQLVAGDVNRVQQNTYYRADYAAKSAEGAGGGGFREESFFEYHLYTLQHPTTVREKEQKQVTLLSAKGTKIQKRLMFYGQEYWYRSQYGEVQSNQKVGVYLDIQNTEKIGLGIPLPKGTVRVYKEDKAGQKQFIGEDHIDHTPRDERVRIKMGDAFDVVGERKQTSWTALGTCTSESEFEISLRNHKDTAVEVQDWEPVGGEWTILSSSHKAQKEDAFTFTFTVKVPARGETKITYKVRVKWC